MKEFFKTVSVLIPSYNEEKSILKILRKVRAQEIPGFKLEIIVVDDGSRDQTAKILQEHTSLFDQLLVMKKNGGKGAAVKAGLAVAQGDYILFQDADLEYDPAEYSGLLTPVREFGAEVVMGSRVSAPKYIRIHYYWNRLGNALITWVFNVLFNRTFTDIYSCYLLFEKKLLDPEELQTCGFDQQAEILGKIVPRAKILYEVPISYAGRSYEE